MEGVFFAARALGLRGADTAAVAGGFAAGGAVGVDHFVWCIVFRCVGCWS